MMKEYWIANDTVLGSNVSIYPYAVLGRKPQRVGKMYRAVELPLPCLLLGNNCVIGSHAVLYRGASLGDNVFVGDHAWIREWVEIGDTSVVGQGVRINYNAKIGRGVRMMNGANIAGNSVIGDDCWIGMNVCMMNDRKFSLDDPHIGPRIGKNVKIGTGAILFAGITIGDNAKVRAGSIVRGDIAEGVTYG
jgi:serine acetyltransferase